MNLVNRTTASRLLEGLIIRSSFAGRLTGYIARGRMHAPAAIILWNSARVHTLFMRFDLDLYYLDADLRVLDRALGVRPFAFPGSPRGCRHVLEVPSHAGLSSAIRRGDRLGIAGRLP